MHPEKPECRFCGGCRDEYKHFTGVDVQDVQNGQWLEEMGDMIASAVDGMRKVPSYSAYCHEMLAATNNIYS